MQWRPGGRSAAPIRQRQLDGRPADGRGDDDDRWWRRDEDVPTAIQHLDEALPTLPSTESPAPRVIESISALRRLDQLTGSLTFVQPTAGPDDEAAALSLVKLLEDRAGLIESAVRGCLTPTSLGPNRFELAESVRRLVFALPDAEGLRRESSGDRASALSRPDV